MYRFEHISNIRDDLVELISLIERIRCARTRGYKPRISRHESVNSLRGEGFSRPEISSRRAVKERSCPLSPFPLNSKIPTEGWANLRGGIEIALGPS